MPNPYDPRMQMPRGGGFGQQGGYQGQVYNTPPTGNGFGNMNQTMQMTPEMQMNLMNALRGGGPSKSRRYAKCSTANAYATSTA